MKHLLLTLAITSILTGVSHAETYIYLKNDTNRTITLSTEGQRNIFKEKTKTVRPGARAHILSLNRNVNVTEDEHFRFHTRVQLQGLDTRGRGLLLVEHLFGKFYGSDAKFGFASENNRTPAEWHSNGGGRIRTIAFDTQGGRHLFTASGRWDHQGVDTFQNIEYVISEAGLLTPPNELNLLQYNIQQRPYKSPLNGFAAEGTQYQLTGTHNERSRLSTVILPRAVRRYDSTIDVITVNEAFTAALRDPLRSEMAKIGFTYDTAVVGKNSSKPWSGGVMVFSKHPIEKKHELIYRRSAADDSSAAKGVLYVSINKEGKRYHVFATHTNASYTFTGRRLPLTDEGRIARRGQFAELRNFLDSQRIPSNEPVLIVGDMNVDMVSEKGQDNDEYSAMLAALGAIHPTPIGHPYSLDKNTNEWVEPDDGPSQYLDYGLYSSAHQRPQSAFNKVVCLKADGRDIARKSSSNHDLSDHYPLQVKMTFPNYQAAIGDTDFDGDNKADIGIWRPSDGKWTILLSSQNFSYEESRRLDRDWGRASDTPITADFDGDGKADVGVHRQSEGIWTVRLSSKNWSASDSDRINITWGRSTDIPLFDADFDGDDKADIGIWRPSDGKWTILLSSQNYSDQESRRLDRDWGRPGDTPITTDFDGDGKADMGVYRQCTGQWTVRLSSENWSASDNNRINITWGRNTDIPLFDVDFDGDNKADIGIWRPSDGTWTILLSSHNYSYQESRRLDRPWGSPGDVPIAADFDGDGKDDMGVYRQSTGQWTVRLSSKNWSASNDNRINVTWGRKSDIPIVDVDFDGDNKADIGIWRPSDGSWKILLSSRNYSDQESRRLDRTWGRPGDTPVMRSR